MKKSRKKPEDLGLPETITILGCTYKVEVTDLPDDEYGETLGYERIIKIAKNHDVSNVQRTLFHEAVHAALHTSGCTALLHEKQEEAIVMAMEHAFSDYIDMDKFIGKKDE